jgi:hypothetical protein
MPSMKIHGGDLDYVTCEFNSYPPGPNLKIRGYEKKREAEGRNMTFDRMKV